MSGLFVSISLRLDLFVIKMDVEYDENKTVNCEGVEDDSTINSKDVEETKNLQKELATFASKLIVELLDTINYGVSNDEEEDSETVPVEPILPAQIRQAGISLGVVRGVSSSNSFLVGKNNPRIRRKPKSLERYF